MKTELDETDPRVDEALSRVRKGVERGITRRKRTGFALAAAGTLVATIGIVAAVVPWPSAAGNAPYIACFDPRVDGAVGTGVGFDMRDPIGFCLDSMDYDDGNGLAFTWAENDRDDLVACHLAAGVAGVFLLSTGNCESHGYRDWTPGDAEVAAEIRATYDAYQLERFGIRQPPVSTTPSQVLPE